jgi:hypothetical protein
MMQRKPTWMYGTVLDRDADEVLESIECAASYNDIATPPRKKRNLHYELVKWNHLFTDDVTSRYLEA